MAEREPSRTPPPESPNGADPSPPDNETRGERHATPRTEEPAELRDPSPEDEGFMALALEEARAARDLDEVPIGAVIVLDGRPIGRGHNRLRLDRTPLAHAELLALREAVERTGDARLPGAVAYCTVEPCFMCAGALSHARVARVVWGVRDEKFGGCVSLGRVLTHPGANHRAELVEGVGADEARELLQTFFRSKRETARRPGEDRTDDAPPAADGPQQRTERCQSG